MKWLAHVLVCGEPDYGNNLKRKSELANYGFKHFCLQCYSGNKWTYLITIPE